MRIPLLATIVAVAAATASFTSQAAAQDPPPLRFETLHLSDLFYCEGATFGDFNRDGKGDVVSGPYWYAGPDFSQRHELAEPVAFDPLHYSKNFFAFPYDFDRDGWLDLFFIGFPGERAWWAENPRGAEQRWVEHEVFAVVDNESPAFTDINGDGQPELVCISNGRYGYATFDPKAPATPWTFHPLSPDLQLQRFTHGLGVGDVNGDRKPDVLERTGWWEQPAALTGDPDWIRHEFPFSTGHGGAQMYATDVDGDGDADVIASLNGHGYGLSWFEHVKKDNAITFVEHRLMDGPDFAGNPPGVCFSELHAVDLADFDGDGLLDLVTGKRWWAHGPEGTPGAGDPAVLYWWKLERKNGGATFIPHLIHNDSGVGVQVDAGDINGDGRTDVVVGNKKGTFVHLQKAPTSKPPEPAPQSPPTPVKKNGQLPAQIPAQLPAPRPDRATGELPRAADGHSLNFDFETGTLADWTVEGDAFEQQPIRGDAPAKRQRESSRHEGDFWIGGYELFGDDRVGSLLSAPFVVTKPWASFLVGGGGWETTVVELLLDVEQKPFYHCVGALFETLQPVAVDLSAELGRAIRIRLVDQKQGHWGHLNFDDFRVHDVEPATPRPAGVPEILEPDPPLAAGLSPADAARAMTVPPGFHVDVIAAEPDLQQPIALAIDAKGRLWVAEAFSYPHRRAEGDGRDSIVVFEDRDSDGKFETRTVFAEKLNLVSGLEIGFGGVFVGAAPYLLFIADRDDDLKPDGAPEVLLDGWGYEDTHETLNAFIWGPDGWLYGCHGVFTHARVGKPGTPDAERVPLNAGIWRYQPQRREFEIFCAGTSNPWGVDWNDQGEAFCTACVIPHLYHCVPGGRYIRQAGGHFNPYTYLEIDTIADHHHYAGGDPYAAIGKSAKVGGGHAHCGALIYLADQFPAEYRNGLLMGNIHGNRVNRDVMEPNGSGYVGHHAPDFLLANDRWFRHISSRLAPDGSVYFIDWYDAQACHTGNDEIWNRSNGRLYRVSYGEPERLPANVPAMSNVALLRQQLSANEWWVRRTRVELQQRGLDADLTRTCAGLMVQHPDATRRLRFLWLLHVCGKLTEELARGRLSQDSDEHVRGWAVRLLGERGAVSPIVRADLLRLAMSDPSAVVRREIASVLQRLPLADRWEIVAALLAHQEDAGDPNLPALEWYALEPLVGADPGRALAMIPAIQLRQLHALVVRRAAADPKCHDALVAALGQLHDVGVAATMLDEMHGALREQRGLATPVGWPAVYAELTTNPHTERPALAVAIDFGDRSALPQMRAAAANRGADPAWRRQAIDALVQLKDADATRVLQGVLDDGDVRAAALRALAAFDSPSTAKAILARYALFTPDERRDALTTLVSRASFAKELLVAVGAGTVARGELPATVLRRLRELADPEVDALVKQHFGLLRDTPEEKKKRIAELKAALPFDTLANADKTHGRALFVATCMKCHTLFGAGGKLAPDLTGANRSDLDYLLTNSVDPNATIGKDYQVTNVIMKDGRIVSGLLVRENESALSVATENETVTLARADVASAKLSSVSLMPEGQLDLLKPAEIRDLFAYLQSPAQVPVLATAATAPDLFNGKDLAFWIGDPALFSVDGGAIVGRTAEGIPQNAFLLSELLLADFRLTLEVRLVGDAGNSGIQFRSERHSDDPLRFEMKGYQADVGPGWWGKLYEENGRGLLSKVSGEPFLERDGWNRYEIVCTGSRIRTALNGHVTTDLDDPQGSARGQLALQVHSGGATEVRFRNLALELDPTPLPAVGTSSTQ